MNILVSLLSLTVRMFQVFSSFTMMFVIPVVLIMLNNVSSKPSLSMIFIMKRWCISSKTFFFEMIVWFLSLSLLMWLLKFINLYLYICFPTLEIYFLVCVCVVSYVQLKVGIQEGQRFWIFWGWCSGDCEWPDKGAVYQTSVVKKNASSSYPLSQVSSPLIYVYWILSAFWGRN